MTGRVLALDPGSERVGVAVSDSARDDGLPAPGPRGRRPARSQRVRQLVDEEEISLVVVGLPKSLSGAEGAAAAEREGAGASSCRACSRRPVLLHDERLTTVEASQALSAAGRDQRAAALARRLGRGDRAPRVVVGQLVSDLSEASAPIRCPGTAAAASASIAGSVDGAALDPCSEQRCSSSCW